MQQVELVPPADLDGRTQITRRLREILDRWADDFRGVQLTENQLVFARRAATIILWTEAAEAAWANNGTPLPANYAAMVSLLERLLSKLDRVRHFGATAA